MSTSSAVRCYIGLGSNLNNPLQQLNLAKQKIAALSDVDLLQWSSIYQSQAITIGGETQQDYLNAVLEIRTILSPEQLLDYLQQLENAQGRVRQKRWAARTLDLDILLYGDQQINSVRLTVPHIEMQNRNFVLLPLLELSPNLKLSGQFELATLIKKNCDQVLEKVNQFNE